MEENQTMENEFSSNITLDTLEVISEELAVTYQRLCLGSGVTPSTTLLDHIKASLKTEGVADPESSEAMNCQPKSDSVIKILLEEETDENGTNYVAVNDHLLDIICDQLRHLKKAVNFITELCLHNNLHSEKQYNSSFAVVDLVEKTESPEYLLSMKNERIATLLANLKAEKQSNEIAMDNLKRGYEKEKAIVCDEIVNLRNELNVLRETKSSIISLRTMYAKRCDQFIAILNKLQLPLTASEEEIKQLNSLISEMCSSTAKFSKI